MFDVNVERTGQSGSAVRHELMPEVALAGEDHRQPALVRRGDDFRIAHRAARLNHRANAGVREDVQAISKREERVGRCERARRWRSWWTFPCSGKFIGNWELPGVNRNSLNKEFFRCRENFLLL